MEKDDLKQGKPCQSPHDRCKQVRTLTPNGRARHPAEYGENDSDCRMHLLTH
jgi:hypothetical protein